MRLKTGFSVYFTIEEIKEIIVNHLEDNGLEAEANHIRNNETVIDFVDDELVVSPDGELEQ